MRNVGKTRAELNVVAEQVGTPTNAADLAEAIIAIINNDEWKAGIYHYSNEGVCSWYDFTKAIHDMAGINTCRVNPINNRLYPTPAKRPIYSVLDQSKIKKEYNITIPYWRESMMQCVHIWNNE